MRQLSIREMRSALGNLDRLVAESGEIIITRHGKAIARVVPLRDRVISPANHSALRKRMPRLDVPSEVLLREDRDR